MAKFEKLSEFKKSVKSLVRGAIKAGVFTEDGKYTFEVFKQTVDKETKTVAVAITNGAFTFAIDAEVCTRVFNKIVPELFEAIIAQFEKLNKVKTITFEIKDAE